MRAVVTGAAGFVGSTLTDALLAGGHSVLAVDCFTPYYDPGAKRRNLDAAARHDDFELAEVDLLATDVAGLLDGADVVFHLAGQPGVRRSWSEGFDGYTANNVVATQRVLEAARTVAVPRLVYASSSSVYGRAERYPTTETDLPRPFSPYGVTKLAAEHLCTLYAENWAVPTISLRYFTVYGPRQRPDMAFHALLRAGLDGTPFRLFGTGDAVRDFTFVDDVVVANLAAATADVAPGTVVNVAGGSEVSMREVLGQAEAVLGRPIDVRQDPTQPGDVPRTAGAIARASELLGWAPTVPLADGLAAQARWQRDEQPAT